MQPALPQGLQLEGPLPTLVLHRDNLVYSVRMTATHDVGSFRLLRPQTSTSGICEAQMKRTSGLH